MIHTPVVAGNWKMHHGPPATRRFLENFSPSWEGEGPTLILFPPALSLAAARASLPAAPPVQLGVQNIHWEEEGAFTGEISSAMAAACGATYALVGHSERRHLFGESDEEVARKIAAALRHDLVPVVCVGETLAERREGRVREVITGQLAAALVPLLGREGREFLVAYEPVWAIGTGESATPDDASAAHRTLRLLGGGDGGGGGGTGPDPLWRERQPEQRRGAPRGAGGGWGSRRRRQPRSRGLLADRRGGGRGSPSQPAVRAPRRSGGRRASRGG